MTQPPSVNEFVNYATVLYLLGQRVKSDLPTICNCPLCQARMSVYSDPRGGAWYHCNRCGFAGDSVQLYQAAKRIPDVRDAIACLWHDADVIGELNDERVKRYLNLVLNKRLEANAFWQRAQRRLTSLDMAAQTLLQQYELHTGYPWRAQRFIGVADKEEVAGLPREPGVRGNVLVVPLQDLPGRHVGFYFLGNRFVQHYMLEKPEGPADRTNGIAFLTSLETHNQTVVAVNDIELALQLHTRYQLATGDSAWPVVAWTGPYVAPWDNIKADAMIFWSREIDANVRQQAARSTARTVRVADNTLLPEDTAGRDVAQYVTTAGEAQIIQDIYNAAAPLTPVIETPGTTTAVETESSSAPTESSSGDDSRYFADSAVYERPDGLYVQFKRRALTKVCDAILRIERVTCLTHSKRVRCQGEVLYKTHIIPFDTDALEIVEHSARWIQKLVMLATGEMLYVNKAWSPRMYLTAVRMHPPIQVVVDDGLTWCAERQTWEMPRCSLTPGGIVAKDVPDTLEDVTIANTPVLSDADIRTLLSTMEVNDATAGMWALLALVIHNALSAVKAWPVLNIGLLCTNLVDHYLTQWLHTGLSLPHIHVSYKETPASLLHPAEGATLPYVLTISEAKHREMMLPILSARTSTNIVMAVPHQVVAIPGLYPTWMFVPNVVAPPPRKEFLAVIPAVLQWLTAHGNELPVAETSVKSVLLAMDDWLAPDVKDVHAITQAATAVLGLDVPQETQPARAMILLMLTTIASMEYKKWPTDLVKSIPEDNAIGLRYYNVRQILVKMGHLLPVTGAVTQALSDVKALVRVHPKYIVIDRQWWDDCCERLMVTLAVQERSQEDLTRLLALVSVADPASQPVSDTPPESARSTKKRN